MTEPTVGWDVTVQIARTPDTHARGYAATITAVNGDGTVDLEARVYDEAGRHVVQTFDLAAVPMDRSLPCLGPDDPDLTVCWDAMT